jgi:hypothetical protein
VPSLTPSYTASEFDHQSIIDATRYGRVVLYANIAEAGNTSIHFDSHPALRLVQLSETAPVESRHRRAAPMRYSIRNPSRVASASLKGYWYQLLYSVSAWLDLSEDEVLVVEGNEDLDRLIEGAQPETIEEQLKFRSSPLAPSDQGIKDAVLNFAEGLLTATKSGWRYSAMFRTNAQLQGNETAIGKWIGGVIPSGHDLHVALLHLARAMDAKRRTTSHHHELVVSELGVRGAAALAAAVTWTFASGSLEEVEARLLTQLATLAPTVDQNIVLDRLLVHLCRKISSTDLKSRMLRRQDLSLAFNDVALDALCEADSKTPTWSTLALWYQRSNPAIAIALYVESESQAARLFDLEQRTQTLMPNSRDPVHAMLPHLDFVAYVAIRKQKGPRGARTCIRGVIRQSEYRHSPQSILLDHEPEDWFTAWINNRRHEPTATISVLYQPPLFAVARWIAQALVDARLDELQLLGTKLRWIWMVDSGSYFTAETIQSLAPLSD